MPKKSPNGRFRSGILRFIFFFTQFRCVGVHPGQYESRFGPRSCTMFFSKESYLLQLLNKPPNGRFRSEILRFIFFSTLVCSLGIHPGQYKSRFSPFPEGIFVFQYKLCISVAKKAIELTVPSEILQFIFFSTHFQFLGVHPGQYKSRFGPRCSTNFFPKKSYLF